MPVGSSKRELGVSRMSPWSRQLVPRAPATDSHGLSVPRDRAWQGDRQGADPSITESLC